MAIEGVSMPELNLIDEKKLQAAADEVIQRAAATAAQEVIPALEAALARIVASTLADLDGWTLTFTVRLGKPKPEGK
jgi:hypothetical protein